MDFKQDFFEQLPGFYETVAPAGLPAPSWLAWSDDAAVLVGNPQPDEQLLQQLAGNQRMPGANYYAQVYSGHQFGGYSPQLGDGRSIILGEAIGPNGCWDVALKGAGATPFSRHGDGRAVTRSAIREFLVSEALFHLNVPTTRALAVIGSALPVWRETLEKGAITVRLARSHIRFGHFEYCYYSTGGKREQVQQLADFTIRQHFPHLSCDAAGYRQWFVEVVEATARLIATWQAIGFAHGVMNTDNMSILGDSFDFGPFAFLDTFKEDFICNHSDPEGRYAFGRQPGIGLWNLQCLAQALTPLISSDDLLAALTHYQPMLVQHYLQLMRQKLGLPAPAGEASGPEDLALFGAFTAMLEQQQLDYSLTLRQFATLDPVANHSDLRDMFVDTSAFDHWFTGYCKRLGKVDNIEQWQEARRLNNPQYILRNYLAQKAIAATEAGDTAPLQQLYQLLRRPYDAQPGCEDFARRPPDWGEGLIMSCSS
ncbi:YdiU family protein [Shewanella yunxiaonensis]|uniref:Protein nucleotidyltransferase YdiU n=1 Tax=Shewanella yunxiaonensis TaxID=2829809 RepID=A0ABX7YTJ3_9GAMM|nr:YdiU family protein [Shewanella yunxiaonensis]QUN05644.1 YdiU family protein [Shewanella yunxiaonensis]